MQLKLPLTLTLSPSDGAREDRSLRWGKSLNGESEQSAGSVLLLPFGRGEGRDEGFSRLHTYGLVSGCIGSCLVNDFAVEHDKVPGRFCPARDGAAEAKA